MAKNIGAFVAIAVGVIFVMTGAFKLLTPLPGESTSAAQSSFEPRAFSVFLTQLQVPFAATLALLIPLLEVIGGLGLIARRGVRLWTALLACDMAAAIVLVGVPGVFGRTIQVGEYSIGTEWWRLPLEIVLLIALAWLLFPLPRRRV